MMFAGLVLGAPAWLAGAIGLTLAALGVLVWSYRGSGGANWVRTLAFALKAVGLVALAICLVEPLLSGMRPKPQSNLFLVLADNSRSLEIHDRGNRQTRGQALQARLAEKTPWQTRLAQDFDVRRYAFDTRLEPVKDFSSLNLQGEGSALAGSLMSLAERFQGRPLAGMLLFTDGNATDLPSQPQDWQRLPPIYPVVLGSAEAMLDVSLARVTVTQTNFEAAPVTIAAEVEFQDIGSRGVVLRVLDEAGKELERRTIERVTSDQPLVERFQLRPEKPGISFYRVQAALLGEEQLEGTQKSAEATLANNSRLVAVDRGGGPYRVLYVSGRPNWEFKFLRRSLQEDDEVNLVGLVRVAKEEPKFTFRGRAGESTNPLFRGFTNQQDEAAEQYHEPVLLRLGTEDKDELRGGFPKGAEDLFRYHAIVLDDLEAAFFTQEQMSLVQQFVSHRGGGFLMLGGRDSFAQGSFQRTPIGDLLPVYLDRSETRPAADGYRLLLTREGWLQPWVRIRTNEQDEQRRLDAMPGFRSVNRVNAIKPGASVLASLQAADGLARPALVVQQFGHGRAAALLVGDLWRWNMQRPAGVESDLEKSWRQTVRWLVADVPQRVEVTARRESAGATQPLQLTVRVRDERYDPLDNASVSVQVQTPDKRQIELTAETSTQAAGEYLAHFAPRAAGAYRARVRVKAADGSPVGEREIGWAVEPATDEFRTLRPNRDLLERLARETGGEVIELGSLERFVAGLPNRKIPVVEAWNYPLWHHWSVFLVAAACLIGEWGLRRWKGLP